MFYSANGHLALNLDGVTIKGNTATDNRSGGVIAYTMIKENGTSDACSVIVEFESSTSIPEVVLSGSAT